MKKAAIIIFLAFTYAASSTGLAVKADYCCDILQSLKLVLKHKAEDKEGCCKVKYQSLKVNDTHAAADIVKMPASTFIVLDIPYRAFEVNNTVYETGNLFQNIHAPPLISSAPVYISNCILRI